MKVAISIPLAGADTVAVTDAPSMVTSPVE